MKVLIAASTYPPDAGGPARHAQMQFEGLPKLGIETKLAALAGFRMYAIGLRHLLFFLKLITLVPSVDVVYAHDAVGAGIPALLAARIFGKKFIVRIGGDVAWERHAERDNVSIKEWYADPQHERDLMFRLARFLILHADLVIVISSLQLEIYKKYYGISPDKIILVLNPVPMPDGNPGEVEKNFIFASRLTAYKNLNTVLKAMVEVVIVQPELRFVIMGHGPEELNLKQLTQELHLERNVVFTGGVSAEEVRERTSKCLFVIAPALTEFNPNYVMEGVGLGKPFLISRENGLPLDVPVELTFDPRNPAEIADKIIHLMERSNYEKAENFVRNSKISMSWQDNLKRNAELIHSVIIKR